MLGISESSHPAHHRFPVWWTGDDKSLSYSINSMVQAGVSGLKPYVHSDCGGVADKKTGLVQVGEFVRWSQHCALGSIHRYHGGPGHQAWLYSEEVEGIVRNFLQMRMKLMPTMLAAAEQASLDATPIVQRLDLVYPDAKYLPNSSSTSQYLFAGDDLLVAPFSQGTENATREVWLPPGSWRDAWTGAATMGPRRVSSTQPLARIPIWHREGGMLVTAPYAQTIDEQDWSELTVHLFPTSPEEPITASTMRVTREAEDTSGQGKHSHELTLRQDAGTLHLAISPACGKRPRSWLVRCHLPRGVRIASASHGRARLVSPPAAEDAEFVPLGGEGAAPPFLAGAVVEFRLTTVEGTANNVALTFAKSGLAALD